MAERNDSPVEGEIFYFCFPCVRVRRRTNTKIEFKYVSSDEPSFTCRRCQQSCQYALEAKKVPPRHKSSHRCGDCNVKFRRPSDLFNHSYGHSGDWPIRCTICYEGFAMNSCLERHQLRRAQPKDLKCRLCRREFEGRICPRTFTDLKRLNQIFCRNCTNVEIPSIIEYVNP
ncbi:hypothetical protein TNCV_1685971 [Trichonephila clavipes]|nr:hypothetical protein TNCV_1685971 [Trichonephila clavipes]